MPLIHVKTNQTVTKPTAEAIKTACGSAITLLSGKTEAWLMVEVEGERMLYFKGSDAPCALASVDIFGQASHADYDKLTAELTGVLAERLSVPADRVYIKYQETDHWGWNGTNF